MQSLSFRRNLKRKELLLICNKHLKLKYEEVFTFTDCRINRRIRTA